MISDKELHDKAIEAGLKAWFHRANRAYVEANKESLRKDFERAIKAYLAVVEGEKK